MCFPPCCQPARKVLGCLGLKHGAAGVLVLDALYGLSLLVVHAVVLGEEDVARHHQHRLHESYEPPGHELRSRRHERGYGSAEHGYGYEASGRRREALEGLARSRSLREEAEGEEAEGHRRRHSEHRRHSESESESESSSHGIDWLLQLVDLDIGWHHGFMPTGDRTTQILGLSYGLFVVCLCSAMLNAVLGGPTGSCGDYLPSAARWFVAFMNIQIILYVGLVLAKLPKLCELQEDFYPLLYMDCDVLWFMYIQRVSAFIVAASLCTWVFSSFAFMLTFGNAALDRPEYGHELEMADMHGMGMAGMPPGGVSMKPPAYTSKLPGSYAPLQHSMATGPPAIQSLAAAQSHHSMASRFPASQSHQSMASRHSLALPPAQAHGGQSHGMSMHTGGPPPTMAHQQSGGGQGMRTSYRIGGGTMPRASSSMVTSATDHSQHDPRHFIKPPVAIF